MVVNINSIRIWNFSTANRLKVYTSGQLIFGRDMILPMKNKTDWELIGHHNQAQINKDNTRKNRIIAPHDYKVGDKVMFNNKLCKNEKYHIRYRLRSLICV